MYRTDPIMARGEGDTGILRSNFVERVVKLPMVHVAWDFATNTYSQIKESNKLVNFTLSSAEKSAIFVVGQAKPVVLKFEKQIQAVDSLACIGLGTLEERVPLIKKDAQEIISDTRKLYTETVYSRLEGIKKVGTDTARTAADFGLKQATSIFGERLVQSALSTVDGVLVITQSYVDHFLPPTKDEKQHQNNVKEEKEQSPLRRIRRLTKTVQQRTYKSALLRVEYIQEKTVELFVIYPFSALEITKSNFDQALQYVTKLWSVLLQEESEENNSEKSRVEQQLLHLARLVSRQVASTYSTLVPLKSSQRDQEPKRSPAVIDAATERLLWLLNLLKSTPELLPMYVSGLISWLDSRNKTTEVKNGSIPKSENNHTNNVQNNKHEELTSSSDHHSDSSIPEEDEESEE